MLLALTVRAIKRISWEKTSVWMRLAYQVLRAFREYITAAPIEEELRLPTSRSA